MDELSHAKKLVSKNKFNGVILFILLAIIFCEGVWGLINKDPDTLAQTLFFIALIIISLIGFYIFKIRHKKAEFPKDPTDNNLKEFQVLQCTRFFSIGYLAVWTIFVPFLLGNLGVLSMEGFSRLFIWWDLAADFLIFILVLARNSHMEKYYENTYERITGKRYINF